MSFLTCLDLLSKRKSGRTTWDFQCIPFTLVIAQRIFFSIYNLVVAGSHPSFRHKVLLFTEKQCNTWDSQDIWKALKWGRVIKTSNRHPRMSSHWDFPTTGAWASGSNGATAHAIWASHVQHLKGDWCICNHWFEENEHHIFIIIHPYQNINV